MSQRTTWSARPHWPAQPRRRPAASRPEPDPSRPFSNDDTHGAGSLATTGSNRPGCFRVEARENGCGW